MSFVDFSEFSQYDYMQFPTNSKYDKQGESGLANKSTAARNHPRKVPAEIVAKIVHMRRKYHLGPIRIGW